ncbi:MAG: hypothetical protein RL702_2202 [Pseudomonadota bacterium]|jgi:uncharacterized membrane protein YhaH (DUF805 family)|nr:DUF805 domain-containing protein [Novosphingobium sp.]HOA49842.1 DUF805 domain-containing protein [Novosphingobium sp.]HPB23602.1 DUF805 domain-containing protein [Novosphingobium sp.]HPZ47913.1 DUF805 domain-containing protein [Novosphingobium sp.]HQE00282.1 DUF805 domain-containing protein [Novosphingobium sp.]
MLDWMLMPYKRYADFSGRSRRKEFWLFQLFVFIVYFVLMIVAGMGMSSMTVDPETGAVSGGGLSSVMSIVVMLFWVATIIPLIAVQVRRCHDQDKSGWFILVPIYGFVLMFIEGTRGPNRFGPDPKAEENASAAI